MKTVTPDNFRTGVSVSFALLGLKSLRPKSSLLFKRTNFPMTGYPFDISSLIEDIVVYHYEISVRPSDVAAFT